MFFHYFDWKWIFFLVLSLVVFINVWFYVILYGSSPKGKPYDKFVFRVTSKHGDHHFLMSLFSFGFFKVSWRRLVFDMKRYCFPSQPVEVGTVAPNAQLVRLHGQIVQLKEILSQSGDMPVILNMGSYT
jgi:hypothetical protein